jgi:hypothetical protein
MQILLCVPRRNKIASRDVQSPNSSLLVNILLCDLLSSSG